MREPQAREAGPGVCLVPPPVPRLLGRRAVVAQAVGFHDKAEFGPEEVDAEAVDDRLRLGRRKPGCTCKGKEEALQLGVGEKEGLAVQQAAQDSDAWQAGQVVDARPQRHRIDQVQAVRFVDCT